MSEIKLEKNIPLPTAWYASKYPFSAMNVGDSFFVPGIRSSAEISATVCAAKKKLGFELVCRKVVENGIPVGVRVWMTK